MIAILTSLMLAVVPIHEAFIGKHKCVIAIAATDRIKVVRTPDGATVIVFLA